MIKLVILLLIPTSINVVKEHDWCEVVKTKVLLGTYPSWYGNPRRKSNIMPIFKLSEQDIKALCFYIENY